jgi:putative transcriptional regulator
MTDRRDIGEEILQGIRQLKHGESGRAISMPSVRSIRDKTGLSQAKFAALLGVSVRTLQDWEQERRVPSGAARTLLLIADKNPEALVEVA